MKPKTVDAMKRKRVVIDTNILVSGLLNPSGAPGRIVDMLLNDDFELAVDDRILLEYQQVLTRPKFGFAPSDVYQLIAFIKIVTLSMTVQPMKIQLPDLKDQPFLEVVRAANADAIVTGNMKHFPNVPDAVTPGDFVQNFLNTNQP